MNKRKQTVNELSRFDQKQGSTDGTFSTSAVPATSTRKPRTLGRRVRRSLPLTPEQIDSAPADALVTVTGVGGPFPRLTMLTYRRDPSPVESAPQVKEPEPFPKLGVVIR